MQIISAMAKPVQWMCVLNFTFFLLFHRAIVFGETYLPTMANAAQDVFFSVDLSLENTGRDAYNGVILFLRERLKGDRYFNDNPNSPLAHTWYSHNLPVLRPQLEVEDPKLEAKAVPWFELVVQTPKKNRVTFKLRRDNLYVVGFQVHRTTGNDQWREFQRKYENGTIIPYSLIPGSNILPFGGSYLEMGRYGGITLGKTYIGKQKLIDAVDGLVPVNTTDAERAQCLLVVIFMISESTRFRYISDFINKNYDKDVRVGSDTVQDLPDLVTTWDKLSPALLRVDAGMEFYIENSTYDRIKKEQQAVAVLGILKYTSYRKNSNDATAATSTLPVPLSTA